MRFAIELQAAVVAEELPRPVGIGIDTGEAVPVEDGFRGGALNRAARLCALAKPGEVLASDAVRELAGATEGIAFGFRRIERLKGFDKPVGVVEVHHAETAPGRELGRSIKRAAAGAHPRRRAALVVGIVAVAIGIVAAVGLTGGSAKASPIDSVGLLDAKTLDRTGSITDLGKSDTLWDDSVHRAYAEGVLRRRRGALICIPLARDGDDARVAAGRRLRPRASSATALLVAR